MKFKEVKIEIYVPKEYVVALRDELNKINVLRVRVYDNVFQTEDIEGYWRPF